MAGQQTEGREAIPRAGPAGRVRPTAGARSWPPPARRSPWCLASVLALPAVLSVLALMAVLALAAGCTGANTVGSTGTVALTPPSSARPVSTTATPTPTPVTPDGMATGPGVTDNAITIGVLDDPGRDRGFAAGLRLWQTVANKAGGSCGRQIQLVAQDSGESAAQAYERLARTVLGFAALAGGIGSTEGTTPGAVAGRATDDGISVLTDGGSSTELSSAGPLPLGATQDIQAINALSYLMSRAIIADRSTVGVIVDGTADSINALAGARWWAARAGITLDVHSGHLPSAAGWGQVAAILAVTTPDRVRAALAAAPVGAVVATTLDGYDPRVLGAADRKRLVISMQTPAFGSDQPAAAAVAKAFVDAGGTNPGPRLLTGYAVGAGWGRVLEAACGSLALTRPGIRTVLESVGPAPVDSLFGPSDPGLVIASALPATRVSSMAQADTLAPAGLTPLIWSQAATGIADYVPAH